jgi:hypothetical protein
MSIGCSQYMKVWLLYGRKAGDALGTVVARVERTISVGILNLTTRTEHYFPKVDLAEK